MATTGARIQKSFTDLKAALSAQAIANGAKTETQIAVRGVDNKLTVLTLSATAGGVINNGEESVIQGLIDGWKVAQDAFNTAKGSFNAENVTENYGNVSKSMDEFYLS